MLSSAVSTAARHVRFGARAGARAGSTIAMGADGKLQVPNEPIIPFIEGDGTGPDIWRSAKRVIDAAVETAYGGERKIDWLETYAGEKAMREKGEWLPDATVEAFREHLVGIKGPLTTPIGGGIRSLNVALRQLLDLYVCLRPVQYFAGVPSPVKHPEAVDMHLFRENCEDIYAGIEFEEGSSGAATLAALLEEQGKIGNVRFPSSAAYGIKAVSEEGSKRLIRSAIQFAIDEGKPSVTLVHKGNIMKFTEGAFKDWGYELAKSPEFREHVVTERESWILGNKDADASLSVEDNAKSIDPGYDMMTPEQQKAITDEVAGVLASIGATHGDGKWKGKIVVRDVIADIALQQVLTRASDFSVIATMNLNGDYLSDALAAQVGGIGIAPGGNINYDSGHAIFEATHGTAPKYANLDKVNPGSVILSGEMMLRHLGWREAADLILKGMDATITQKRVTYDFERQMEGATKLKCSEFGSAVIENMRS